jgi:putative membrane protein
MKYLSGMYNYLKALHIIFVVTWFAGMFYMPRLFIYNVEAQETEDEKIRAALTQRFTVMMRRLWYGITFPSAILTLIFGLSIIFAYPYYWYQILFAAGGRWLLIKLFFIILLYAYFISLHLIFKQQEKGIFKYSSDQLRVWNEVATVLLIAIVFLAVVKSALSFVYGVIGIIALIILLMSAIKIYKRVREGGK